MDTNADRILFVDDEQAVLDALARQHRKQYNVVTACGAEAGLRAVRENGPFAVAISDYQMPGMTGSLFLAEARAHDPEMVGMMLTGQADLQTAIDAVNRGHIFRFLTKPCDPEVLRGCIDAALEQRRLRHAEKDLLEKTVRGTIEVLAEVLSLANPRAFGKATRIHAYVRRIVETLKPEDGWQYETAALLSQIGCVAIPDDLLDRMVAGEQIAPEQVAMIGRHPQLARELLKRIPRLQNVAEMVFHQRGKFGSDAASLDKSIVLGGRMLAAALDLEDLVSLGATPQQALRALQAEGNKYDAAVLEALSTVEISGTVGTVKVLALRDIRVGMILNEDVLNRDGSLVIGKGHEVTGGSLQRLRNYEELGRLKSASIRVVLRQSIAKTPQPVGV